MKHLILFIIINSLSLCYLIIQLVKSKNESYRWNCTWIPNEDIYKQDWLLGDSPFIQSITNDTIRGPIYYS